MGMFENLQKLIGFMADSQNQAPKAKPQRGTLIHNSSADGTLRHKTSRTFQRSIRRKGLMSPRQQRRANKLINQVHREE